MSNYPPPPKKKKKSYNGNLPVFMSINKKKNRLPLLLCHAKKWTNLVGDIWNKIILKQYIDLFMVSYTKKFWYKFTLPDHYVIVNVCHSHGVYIRWLLITLCAHMEAYQAFWFVESIWLHRKSHQIRFCYIGEKKIEMNLRVFFFTWKEHIF